MKVKVIKDKDKQRQIQYIPHRKEKIKHYAVQHNTYAVINESVQL